MNPEVHLTSSPKSGNREFDFVRMECSNALIISSRRLGQKGGPLPLLPPIWFPRIALGRGLNCVGWDGKGSHDEVTAQNGARNQIQRDIEMVVGSVTSDSVNCSTQRKSESGRRTSKRMDMRGGGITVPTD